LRIQICIKTIIIRNIGLIMSNLCFILFRLIQLYFLSMRHENLYQCLKILSTQLSINTLRSCQTLYSLIKEFNRSVLRPLEAALEHLMRSSRFFFILKWTSSSTMQCLFFITNFLERFVQDPADIY
jgi:hypothetical protein